MPRQPLPQNSDDIITPDLKRFTPSLSDPSVEEEDSDRQERDRFSPSPEIELFSPELDNDSSPPTPGDSFTGRNRPEVLISRPVTHIQTPSLEADEKGFTETATAVRQMQVAQPPKPTFETEHRHEYGYDLFGSNQSLSIDHKPLMVASSPMIIARPASNKHQNDFDVGMNEWFLSPEAIEVDELDEMFLDY